MMNNNILLVVPCYNEAQRLDLPAFIEWSSEHQHILFFNDGSTDNTADMIQAAITDYPHLHFAQSPTNRGKGEALRLAIQNARSWPTFASFEWIGLWDADLATPLFEVHNMLNYIAFNGTSVDAVFGSRVFRLGAHITRAQHRHYLARMFATIISGLLKVKTYDSQCGAKLFHREIIDRAFDQTFISRWIFDVEIVMRLDPSRILEYPLTQWRDVAGSKLKPTDLFIVLADILRLWKKQLPQ